MLFSSDQPPTEASQEPENIGPAAVETALAAHPSVLDATVFGLPDDRMGEIVAAAIRFREPVDEDSLPPAFAALLDHCRENLSPYMVPSRWFLAGDLPVTPTGKVQKFRLTKILGTSNLVEVDLLNG